MLENIPVENILFLDIETVPHADGFESLSEEMKPLWGKKAQYIKKEHETEVDAYRHAGIYAEFGKIICIGMGYIAGPKGNRVMRIKACSGHDEAKLLADFSESVK